MRKILTLALAVGISVSALPNSSAATKQPPKLSAKCVKAGELGKSATQQLVCTKLNNKLSWQPSVAAIENSNWSDLQSQRASQSDVSTSLEVYFSPTVNKTIAGTLLHGVNQAAKLWQAQYLPEKPLPTLFFTEKDRDWFVSQMKTLGVYSEHQLANFDDEVKRNGNRANWAGVTGDGGRLWMVYMIGSGKTAPDNNDAQVAAHEYTHLAQFAIAKTNQEQLTCWMVEGGAAFYGLYLGATSSAQLTTFTNERMNDGGFLDFQSLMKNPNRDWEKYLDTFGPNYGNSQCGPNGAYQIGGLANEYLYSLKGHPGIISLFQNVASTGDFAKAIENTYSKPWPVVRKEIANYIRLAIAQTKPQ